MTDTRTEHDPALPTSAWAVVANIAVAVSEGPGSARVRRGHAHFLPGAKVYVLPPIWDPFLGHLEVVGLHRGNRQWAQVTVSLRHLTGLRARVVYSPALILKLSTIRELWTRQAARAFVQAHGSEEAVP